MFHFKFPEKIGEVDGHPWGPVKEIVKIPQLDLKIVHYTDAGDGKDYFSIYHQDKNVIYTESLESAIIYGIVVKKHGATKAVNSQACYYALKLLEIG